MVYIFVGFLLREGTEVTSLGGGDFIGYTCQDFLAPVLGGKDFFTAPVGGSNYFVTYFLYKVPKITFFHKRGRGLCFFHPPAGGAVSKSSPMTDLIHRAGGNEAL